MYPTGRALHCMYGCRQTTAQQANTGANPITSAAQNVPSGSGTHVRPAGLDPYPADVLQPGNIPTVSSSDLDAVADNLMFLERIILWMCGVTVGSAEYKEMMSILAQYGGSLYPQLCKSTTHIVVSSMRLMSALLLLWHAWHLVPCCATVSDVSAMCTSRAC